MPLTAGRVDQVGAVEVEQIEEERGQRQVGPLLPAGVVARRPARGDLKRPGPSVREQCHCFPVQNRGRRAEAAHGIGDLRYPGGDVVECPGENGHLAGILVHLDPDSVNLPFHRGGRYPLHGGAYARRGGREHRAQRTPDLQRKGLQGGQRAAGIRPAGPAERGTGYLGQ